MQTKDPSNPLDLLTEEIITLKEAAREFPNQPHVSALYRWATRGMRGVKLGTVRLGHAKLTSRQTLTRFLRRTQHDDTK